MIDTTAQNAIRTTELIILNMPYFSGKYDKKYYNVRNVTTFVQMFKNCALVYKNIQIIQVSENQENQII